MQELAGVDVASGCYGPQPKFPMSSRIAVSLASVSLAFSEESSGNRFALPLKHQERHFSEISHRHPSRGQRCENEE